MNIMADSQPPFSPSSSSRIRQEQIDQLRNRVDSVLKNLIQSTDTGTQSLKSQVDSLRDIGLGPSSISDNHDGGSSSHSSITSDRSLSMDDIQTLPANNTTTRASPRNSGGHKATTTTTTATTKTIRTVTKKQWVVDPYGDQGDYQGELNEENNLPHGFGVMSYSDGRIYAGDFREGRWHGNGRATFSNGDTFEGTYYEDQRHGQGTYRWVDGREYKGGFVNDQRSGQGTYTWPDGAKYEGEFSKGLRHGTGTYTFHDGSVYKGAWKDGFYHGYGECRWSDGRVYKGEWKRGKAHGQGIEIRPDGSVRHDGQWENDKPIRPPANTDVGK